MNYVSRKPSINLDSQNLSESTFKQYRKLWFLSKFKKTYRDYYEIPYKNYAYSDLKGKYFEDFKYFLNIFLNTFHLKNFKKFREMIIYHYNIIIQKIKYSDIPKHSKNPKYFASALLFYIFDSFLNLTQTDFINKLNTESRIIIASFNFATISISVPPSSASLLRILAITGALVN